MTIAIPRPPNRLERLRSWMEDERVDCTVAFGADNATHLCGYARYFGGPSAIVVSREGERTLVVMTDEVRVARERSSADQVVGYGERGFGINLDPVAELVSTVAAQPAVTQAGRIGITSELAGADTRLGAAVSASVVDAGDALYRIRLIKDWDELERIGVGYELCWLAQDAVAQGAVPGTSEIELFTAAQARAQIASGSPIEYVCDLLSGPNTADVCCPIHVAGPRTLAPGDPVIADIVVRTNGYWGDSAETHVAAADGNGDATAARAKLLEILEAARTELVPGATGAEVFGRMNARILDAFPGGEFPHHGGHALGITSFEDPHVIPSDRTPFEPWMVLAIEPGVYFPGRYGARVENVFVVSPEGGVELREALGADGGGD
jgi:Xaa-Pro aminopeptidase